MRLIPILKPTPNRLGFLPGGPQIFGYVDEILGGLGRQKGAQLGKPNSKWQLKN